MLKGLQGLEGLEDDDIFAPKYKSKTYLLIFTTPIITVKNITPKRMKKSVVKKKRIGKKERH